MMISRLACQRLAPLTKNCVAHLRTTVRSTTRTGARQDSAVDKDWRYYGKLLLGGSAVIGGASVCVVGMRHDVLDVEVSSLARSVIWPQYIKDRVTSTYLYFGLGLGATAGTMVLTRNVVGLHNLIARRPILGMVGLIGAQIAINGVQHSLAYTPENMMLKHALAIGLYGMIGTLLGPLLHLGGPIVSRAAMYTGSLVGGLTLAAVTAPSEHYLQYSGPLMMGFCVVAAATVATAFMKPSGALGGGMYAIAVYGGVVLFSALLLYQTQSVIKRCEMTHMYGEYDPISNSIGLYMTAINLFVRILNIVQGRKK